MLDIPGISQIFKHSADFDQGLGNIRKGIATLVVAVDGSGDFASIQDAINSLPSGGGVVYIKEGTYYINEMITIDSNNVSLIGAGRATHLFQGDATNLTYMLWITGTHAYISQLHFDQNESNQSAGSAMVLMGGDHSTMTNCWLDNYFIEAIEVYYVSDIIIANNHTETGPILSQSLVVLGSSNVLVDGNIFDGRSLLIDLSSDSSNINIVGNILTAGTHTVHVHSDNTTIVGNTIISSSAGGIAVPILATADRTTVTSNRILTNSGTPIQDLGTNTEIGHNNTT